LLGKKIAEKLKELLFDSPFACDLTLFTQVIITTVYVLFCVCFSVELYTVLNVSLVLDGNESHITDIITGPPTHSTGGPD